LTAKTVFNISATNTIEGIALLSNIPYDPEQSTAVKIRQRVVQANEVLLEYLESAVQSLRESFFYALDCQGPLKLFAEVAMVRIDKVGRLKRVVRLFEDTLLEAETIGLALEHEKLGFNLPHGPLSLGVGSARNVKPPLRSSFLFLDDLARARDEMCQKHRPTIHPASAALEPPWPRGLPIQYLTRPFNLTVEEANNHMLFIAARDVSVVLLEQTPYLVSGAGSDASPNGGEQSIVGFWVVNEAEVD